MLDEEIVTENGNETKLEEPFKCDICDKTFLRQSWLVRHGFSHPRLNKDKYSCFHCNNLYRGKYAKQYYRKNIDRLIDREERICQTCGHLARDVDFLGIHKQVEHFGLKRFKCEIENCGLEFSKNYRLINHKRTHDTSISYPCDQCSFSSNSRKTLNKHIKLHSRLPNGCIQETEDDDLNMLKEHQLSKDNSESSLIDSVAKKILECTDCSDVNQSMEALYIAVISVSFSQQQRVM